MILVRLVIQTVVLALSQILSNKMRAMLTSLGIIIGVASVIAVIASLGGMKGFVLKEVESFGARKMWVWGYVPRDLRTSMTWTEAELKVNEINTILQHAENVELMTPLSDRRYDVKAGKVLQRGVEVTGIWPEWHEIENRKIILGRPFIRADEEERRQVCLVNDKAIEELQLDRDPIGDVILIKDRRFMIVGVVETREVSPMFGGGDSQSDIFVPFRTSLLLDPYGWVMGIGQIASPERSDEAREEIRFILRSMRGLDPEAEDTFRVEIMQSAIDQFTKIAAAITAAAAGVVSISLLVGGIGIMNIMLVSVSERTREIGLRKAVGANPIVILIQFLIEAVVLCMVGGLAGVLIGELMVLGLKQLPGEFFAAAHVPLSAVALAIGFSASVGVIFGMFPAIKAARLNPIDALRHE